jgi:hypothetical protein
MAEVWNKERGEFEDVDLASVKAGDPNHKLHEFERAGLGKAPFRLVNVYFVSGLRSCDYCGTGIQEICVIRSADGNQFKVGNICVEKTGDRGLVDTVKREVNRLRTQRRNEKADEKIKVALAKLETDSTLREKLAAEPHPYAWLAEKGLTSLDYVDWMLKNGGRKGRGEAAKVIERFLPENLSPEQIAVALARREQRLESERQAETLKAQELTQDAKTANKWLLDMLQGSGGFVESMRYELSRAPLPELRLSQKQLDILADIYGKAHGRANSKAYQEAVEDFWNKREAR